MDKFWSLRNTFACVDFDALRNPFLNTKISGLGVDFCRVLNPFLNRKKSGPITPPMSRWQRWRSGLPIQREKLL